MVAPASSDNENTINVELGEKEAEGIYSNLVLASHSPHEFVIDFAKVLPGVPKAKVGARIVVAPTHMVALLQTLQENLAKYERTFGPISRRV